MISQILENIVFLGMIIIDIIKDSIVVILAKDPCKECLVMPCCSDKCELRIDFEKLILRGESLKSRKILAWFIAIYFSIIILFLIYAIFK